MAAADLTGRGATSGPRVDRGQGMRLGSARLGTGSVLVAGSFKQLILQKQWQTDVL